MTTKTTLLDEDTHKVLKNIQKMLYDKYNINMSIQDVIAHLVPNPDEGVRKIIDSIKMKA